MGHDLARRDGRVIGPATGPDNIADAAIAGGRISAIRPAPGGREVQDVSGHLVVPGLIDLHTPIYLGSTSHALDPLAITRMSGATALVDAGSAASDLTCGARLGCGGQSS